jgi:hypothetical protein
VLNLNKLFPGWKKVAVAGPLVFTKGIEITCDSPGSFEVFSPKGAPCISIQWQNCTNPKWTNVDIRGNWGLSGFGLGWDGSTGVTRAQGSLTDSNVATGHLYGSGHEFWKCTGGVHENSVITDVPIGASRSEGSVDCVGRNLKSVTTQPFGNYVQWLFHHASHKNCSFEKCTVESDTLVPGFELMHGTGGGMTDCGGKNAMVATNNASGWKITNLNITYDAGCIKALEPYPSYHQFATGGGFGTPAVNINQNAGDWSLAQGGVARNIVLDQSAGYLDSKGHNLIAMSSQDRIVGFDIDGFHAKFPAKRSPNSGGAVGLQCYGPDARVANVKVEGECINQQNNYSVFVTKGTVTGVDAPPGSTSINWKVS